MDLRIPLILLALMQLVMTDYTCEGNNLALNKNVSQSNELKTGYHATDGKQDTDSLLCTAANSTTSDPNPWLIVDLEDQYLLSFVTFFNPQGEGALGVPVNFQFYVYMYVEDPTSNPAANSIVCGSNVLAVDGWTWVEVSCIPVVWGRYVRVQKVGATLSVCEIQIYPALRATMVSTRMSWSGTSGSTYPGNKHLGALLESRRSRSRIDCISACYGLKRCIGFNFKIDGIDVLCELFDGDGVNINEKMFWEVFMWER